MIDKINLNYDWKYSENFSDDALLTKFDDSNFQSVNIPHANKEIPFNNFDEEIYQFVSIYRKHVTIDEKHKGKRLILEFEAVANAADVYVNGKLAFSHKGSYTAFSGDITDFVEFGKDNIIAVKVDSTEREDIPPFGNIVDYLVYGGIYREVYIYVHEEEYIKQMCLSPIDVLEKPTLRVDLKFNKTTKKPVQITIINEGKEISKTAISTNADSVSLDIEIKNAKLWDIDNPNLYTIKAELGNDVIEDKVGIREAKFTKNGFVLNGKKIM